MDLSDDSQKNKNIKQLPEPNKNIEKKDIDIEEKNEIIICDSSKKTRKKRRR